MTYDEFKTTWIWALRESTLPILGVDPVEETLGLRSMDRIVKAFVEPLGGQHAEPFHISAALGYRWDALQTARTATTEEDMLQELLGLDRNRKPRTEKPWLRVAGSRELSFSRCRNSFRVHAACSIANLIPRKAPRSVPLPRSFSAQVDLNPMLLADSLESGSLRTVKDVIRA